MNEDKFRVSVKALIEKQDTVLLIKEKYSGKWALPGGGIEKQETPKRALKREVLEETGFLVTPCELISEEKPEQKMFEKLTTKKYAPLFLFFKAKIDSQMGPPKEKDVLEVKFIKKSEILKLIENDEIFPWYSSFLKKIIPPRFS